MGACMRETGNGFQIQVTRINGENVMKRTLTVVLWGRISRAEVKAEREPSNARNVWYIGTSVGTRWRDA
jgi:hypothetical protein